QPNIAYISFTYPEKSAAAPVTDSGNGGKLSPTEIMGKKSSRKNGVGKAPGSITLREESGVKKKQTHVNAKSMLKLEHIKDIATWASGESSIPSLGAFFWQRLAVSAESLGVPPDPSLFTCQRCESVLQAGYNCTTRIEKNKRKARKKRKTFGIPPKNSVVYECHFCSHRNLKRGTPRGYMKSLYPAKPKTLTVDPAKSATRKAKIDPTESAMQRSEHLGTTTDVIVSSELVGDDPMAGPATPLSTVTITSLLDSKKRKRNRTGSKKKVEPQDGSSMTDAEKTVPTSSKRKKKSWTSLKEIAESQSSNSRKFSNISVPFIL
ncbi:hypothetical protein MTR67_037279, partial [Solanum verrucosum]